MKNVLIVASAPSMIGQFNIENILILQSMGYTVHVACNFNIKGIMDEESLNQLRRKLENLEVIAHQVDFKRGIGDIKTNISCYKQLVTILQENKIDFMHCHSPIGGVLGRLAAKKVKIPVIYTAHGFQFFQGGSRKDWLLFYPVEKYLSKYTDILITINNEDYNLAKKFKCGKLFKVSGVGIDYEKYYNPVSSEVIQSIKEELRISEKSKVMISVGELTIRKNHIAGIHALSILNNENIIYLICGSGAELENLKAEAERLDVASQVIFLGYQSAIENYYAISDISLFLSRREGLGLAGLEAMAAGLPLVSSALGGIKDYTEDGKTGYTIVDPTNCEEIAGAIHKLFDKNSEELKKIAENNKNIAKEYDKSKVNILMRDIYGAMGKEI
ncbi:glycosyltransferase [Enterococcus sp. LJL51]|uniref:glycosyltransferase n=1 Tax=Enterococcus sp. LJL51 TaxID=3416656 RepID=UPI003CF6A5C5